MRWDRIIGTIFAAVGAVLMFTANHDPDETTSRWTGWIQRVGLDTLAPSLRLIVGGGLIVAAIVWVYLGYRRALPSLAWAERKQLEISVLANVSAGRSPTASPIDKDPENSRLRELKDAITMGELDATLNGDGPNVSSTVTFHDFATYAASNRPHWEEVLRKWASCQSQAQPRPTKLSEREPPLHRAALWAIYGSAWGQWQRDHEAQLGKTEEDKLQALMRMVGQIVEEAAINGDLDLMGRPPDAIEYEPITPATWRLAALNVVPNPAAIYKFEVIPRTDVDRGRISRVLEYDSLVVNGKQFEAVFRALSPTALKTDRCI